ncbi:MAG: CehA/McbA family metallohydrolase [Acidobacteriota bacterium]
MRVSRREFLETSTAVAAAVQSVQGAVDSKPSPARPGTSNFVPLPLKGNAGLGDLARAGISEIMTQALPQAPTGACVGWGIPFEVGRVVLLKDQPVVEKLDRVKAEWLVFMHTTDTEPLKWNDQGFLSEAGGEGRLGEHVADYVFTYDDGTELRCKIQRRHHIGMFRRRWGENCFQAVPQNSPTPTNADQDNAGWGYAQQRVSPGDVTAWLNWLWAWQNPHPDKAIVSLRFEPKAGTVILSAISAGRASSLPLRWQTRQKALLKLPPGTTFDYTLSKNGLLSQIRLDMGQVISAQPRLLYPDGEWANTYNNKLPVPSKGEVLIEYMAHPDARFHLSGGKVIPVSEVVSGQGDGTLASIAPAVKRVKIRVLDKQSKIPVAVKLHVHGESDEYLAPVDRHRIPNGRWFEDYGPEFMHMGRHRCAYIPGETVIDVPLGNIYLEVSKGFEIEPVRKVIKVGPDTSVIDILLEKVLDWREAGWVTADTHVHFLSPPTAMLEGAAEGVNVVNLLASQWGELMTNVGDFDGKSTFGSKEAGGDGEWLVRVGTENRQHILGHISLLGYRGEIIAPMCAGGPTEAALGDPVNVLMMEWAEQCRKQGGVVVLPHFPNPRAEHAADIIGGVIDAIELTSSGFLYRGIDPYSLSDYYRFLNCGSFVAAVGGTDKMSAMTAVGTVRTYAKIASDKPFTYDTWIEAIKSGNTFASYGPLLDFAVDGKPPGTRFKLRRSGGSLDVTWKVGSVTVPMSRVDLIVNGEIRESQTIDPREAAGHWSVKVEKSSWLALLVRGHYRDQTEMIAAHSSPVMVDVEGSEFFSQADALAILDQVEGALAYIDTVGMRAEDEIYKRMRLRLTSVYRQLHNDLHKRGHYHQHTSITDHPEHHGKGTTG